MSVFERIISDDQVEDATLETIRKWLHTYLAEKERQSGLQAGYYARPPGEGSYTVRADFEKWPEEMLPIVTLIAPGITDDPTRQGRGQVDGKFDVGVTCVVESTDQVATRRYAYRMGAAIRALLTQKGLEDQLDGTVRGVDFLGSRNNELPDPDGRTIWACRQLFVVDVAGIMTRVAGPTGPETPIEPLDPVPDWPTVADRDHVHVAITKEPIEP